jgi:hypothetical protein
MSDMYGAHIRWAQTTRIIGAGILLCIIAFSLLAFRRRIGNFSQGKMPLRLHWLLIFWCAYDAAAALMGILSQVFHWNMPVIAYEGGLLWLICVVLAAVTAFIGLLRHKIYGVAALIGTKLLYAAPMIGNVIAHTGRIGLPPQHMVMIPISFLKSYMITQNAFMNLFPSLFVIPLIIAYYAKRRVLFIRNNKEISVLLSSLANHSGDKKRGIFAFVNSKLSGMLEALFIIALAFTALFDTVYISDSYQKNYSEVVKQTSEVRDAINPLLLEFWENNNLLYGEKWREQMTVSANKLQEIAITAMEYDITAIPLKYPDVHYNMLMAHHELYMEAQLLITGTAETNAQHIYEAQNHANSYIEFLPFQSMSSKIDLTAVGVISTIFYPPSVAEGNEIC